MKASELFARAVELVTGKGAPPTRTSVEQALSGCEARASAAVKERDRLAAERRTLLVGGSDADVAKNGDEMSRATLEQERAEALIIELRACWVYHLYQDVLSAAGLPFSLKSVIAEEDLHMAEMHDRLVELGARPADRIAALSRLETDLFRKLFAQLDQDTALPTLDRAA